MIVRHSPLLLSALFLSACFGSPSVEPTVPEIASSSSSSLTSIAETHNVTYSGRIQPAGVSIFMEGTHRLIMTDGAFILLQSETVDLNGYVGEEAEVTGAVRPTVEQGGTIMRVEQIRLKESSSSSSESFASSASSASSFSLISSASLASSVSVASSVATSSSVPKSTSASSARSSSASSVPVPVSLAALNARTASMAKQNMSESNWTQAYCSSPASFCVPVHRNWWFKSFGTATTSLWHMEVSSEEIENPGEGPIAVDWLTGQSPAPDGEIRTSGDRVTGYRTLTDGKYFAISAPVSLRSAVEYMTGHLTPMETK